MVNMAASRAIPPNAAPLPREAIMAASGWILTVILAGVVAARSTIPLGQTAGAVAIGLLPGLATLSLAPHARAGWARAFIAFGWIGFAAAATGVTGGFGSPLAAAFALAPALAFAIGERAHVAETAFFAALGYAIAGFVAGSGEPLLALGPLPAIFAGASLLIAGGVIAAAPRAVVQAAPVPAREERAVRAAQDMVAAQRRRAAELAHELRTPLTHIIGFADAMRQRLFGPMHDRYGEYIDLIHMSGRNLLDLVNGLLDLSRLEGGRYPLEMEPFDFRGTAEETVVLAQDQARGKTIALTFEAPDALPVTADARALRQILTNLIANALKFTPEGGAVIVRAGVRGRDLVLEVQDNGPGIPAAERARLGQPYERGAAAAAQEGFGLGLSIVRAFAAAHGGALSFHEAPGGGALVRVTLPVARA
jgi:signal transduction histidine kinase